MLKFLKGLLSNDLAIDLGTSNTRIFAKGAGIVVNDSLILGDFINIGREEGLLGDRQFLFRRTAVGSIHGQNQPVFVQLQLYRSRPFGTDRCNPVHRLGKIGRVHLQFARIALRNDARVIRECPINDLRGQRDIRRCKTNLRL